MRLHRAASRGPVKLGAELGRGGEGAVFEVAGNANLVAKIYAKPPGAQKIEKLQAMSRGATPGMLKIAAWPMDVLLDDQRVVRGFLMPKVSSREDLHELYSPRSRAATFPTADFRFLVRVATNLARAFAVVHAQGHVIGDVNHGNALVGHDGTVVLIDCDSFQARDRIKTFSCDVGVPLFTAPELQGKDFRGLRRSQNHDAFGLAVLIFHLLFQGRHPFAGRFAGGEMTIERAIAEHRFAYGSNGDVTGMSPPPGALLLATFGPAIADMFTRAFQVPAAAGDRPRALEWIAVLEAFEQSLAQCASSPAHFHPPGDPCCWCELEGRIGMQFFGRRMAAFGRAVAIDVEKLWQAITAIQHPGPTPAPPTEEFLFAPAERASWWQRSLKRFANRAAFAGAIVSFTCLIAGVSYALPFFAISAFAAIVTSPSMSRIRQRKAVLERATQSWSRVLQRWNDECSSQAFDDVLADLRQARLEMSLLAKRCKEEIEAYRKSGGRSGLRRFLTAFRIDDMNLRFLTRAQRVKLNMSGIRTAADVAREEALIPQVLSAAAAEQLLAWYRMHARAYTGPTDEPADPNEIASIQQRYDYLQQQIAQKLSEGPALLRERHEEITKARARLHPTVKSAWASLSRAQQQQE